MTDAYAVITPDGELFGRGGGMPLIVGERLPHEWAHPDPEVIAVRVMRKQPRRTSRQERRS